MQWAKEVPEGRVEETTTNQGAPEAPGASWWVVPSLGPLSTASDAYKFPNIPETLEESTKNTSIRRKFQNREIQSNTITEGLIILIGASPMMCE